MNAGGPPVLFVRWHQISFEVSIGWQPTERNSDLVIGLGGELDLLQVDPFVLGVGLGDVAGAEDDAGCPRRVDGSGIGAERYAHDVGPTAGRLGDGIAQRFEPPGGPRREGRHVHPGLAELDPIELRPGARRAVP